MPEQDPPPSRSMVPVGIDLGGGTTLTASLVEYNGKITMVTDVTATAAATFLGVEQARAETERYRAEAERHRGEAAIREAEERTKQEAEATKRTVREAEERTKQDKETTEQAKEGTAQSRHKLYRVYAASITLGGGIISCALVPAAAIPIASMVSGVLAVAVGGSYAVEFINRRLDTKTRAEDKTARSADKSPPGESGR